jgi:DNA-binding response OmpR family regulator
MAAILVVEDDGLVARQTARVLRQAGHTTILAHNAREALEEARTPPDLILLDLGLPDLSGEEVLRRLRLQPRTAQIPIVVITGKREAALQVRESEMEYADLLLKPVSAARLRQAVASALGTREVQETAAARTDLRRLELLLHRPLDAQSQGPENDSA